LDLSLDEQMEESLEASGQRDHAAALADIQEEAEDVQASRGRVPALRSAALVANAG